jgi:mono/diheme cytochrome c family protein
MRRTIPLFLVAAGVLLASADWSPRRAVLVALATAQAPRLLSETGLYTDSPSVVNPNNRAYSPQYPLWSDGAGKDRWILLPAGAPIDATRMDRWAFPEGTKFWKEFAFGGRKVETRFIWRATAQDWVFATYLWDDDQKDAALAPREGVASYLEIAPGKRHGIPSVADCLTCHERGVLGFSALQLSTDRDPLAPHAEPLKPGMVTLATLVEEGLIKPAPSHLVETPPRIASDNPHTRAVLGYLMSNCGSCHAADGALGQLGLDFLHSPAAGDQAGEPGFASSVGRAGRWNIPSLPEGATRRIEPGAPERSSVFYRMNSRRPLSQMPPLGTVLPDQQALDLLRRWITEDLRAASGRN